MAKHVAARARSATRKRQGRNAVSFVRSSCRRYVSSAAIRLLVKLAAGGAANIDFCFALATLRASVRVSEYLQSLGGWTPSVSSLRRTRAAGAFIYRAGLATSEIGG